MKTALVHDWLISQGGAERVLEEMLELFPSPIFTLFQKRNKNLSEKISKAAVKSSFIQNLPLAETQYRNYLPLYPAAIERFDLQDYDLILSSSHAVAKGIKTHANQLHICYCHTPMRYAWDLEEQYLESVSFLKAMIARKILKKIREWDVKTVHRVDAFIANSHYVAERIRRLYQREAHVIYPPVATHLFHLKEEKDDFYLTVSRLVPYKRIDLLVEAFNGMPSKKLKIVGAGPESERLRAKAGKNIEFLGFQPDEKVRELLASARGFIFAAEEDFGIAPLEAQASGTPVIAYGKGGSLETVLPGITGLLFPEQTASSLVESLKEFEKIKWNGKLIRSHAEKFGTDRFKKELKQFVDQQWEQFCEIRYSSRR